MIRKKWFLFLEMGLLLIVPAALAALPLNLGQTSAGSEPFIAAEQIPTDSGRIIAASAHQVFERQNTGAWKSLWFRKAENSAIHSIVPSTADPNLFFVLTEKHVYSYHLTNKKWQQVFRGKSRSDLKITTFAVSPEDDDYWLLGTQKGLQESDDAGRTWYPFLCFRNKDISLIRFSENALYIAAKNKLFRSTDLTHFQEVFSLSASVTRKTFSSEEASLEDLESINSEEVLSSEDYFYSLVFEAGQRLWLATSQGIFTSDQGISWRPVSKQGLNNTVLHDLFYLPREKILLGIDLKSIFVFEESRQHWRLLYLPGLSENILSLAWPPEAEKVLFALTSSGLFEFSLSDGLALQSFSNSSHKTMLLFKKLLSLEPTARQVQEKVIDYANVGNGKIKRWHAASRLSSLFPSFSYGKDLSRNTSISTYSGKFIEGPEDSSKGWDADWSWDFGDFIWSSSQTSIDSRDKLTVELRQDLLSEANRIFYERRRLQTEMVFIPAATPAEHFDRLIHMDELASLLDGMTNGWMGEHLQQIYRLHPEFETLWAWHENNEQHTRAPAHQSTGHEK